VEDAVASFFPQPAEITAISAVAMKGRRFMQPITHRVEASAIANAKNPPI
jgi:hypothetical protein